MISQTQIQVTHSCSEMIIIVNLGIYKFNNQMYMQGNKTMIDYKTQANFVQTITKK